MAGRFEVEDQSVVEFQLGNKQLLLLFVGLLVICAIFFFIGLRVGEDTARSKAALVVSDDLGSAAGAQSTASGEQPKQTNALALDASAASRSGATSAKPDRKLPESKPAEKPAELRSETKPASSQTAAASSQPSGEYYLQVASPTDESSARRLQKELSAIYPTILQPVTVKGRQHFRVKIGPFPTSEKAQEFKRSMEPRFKDAIVAKL
jgi:cell division septation protein DedD